MGNRAVAAARQTVDARLDALFRSGWTPPASGQRGPDLDRDPPADESDEPAQRRPSRWRIDPGRRAAAAMVAVVAVTALAVGWRVLADRPQAQAIGDGASVRVATPTAVRTTIGSSPGSVGAVSGTGAPSVSAVTTPAGLIVVDVVGRVRHPGVVRLRAGSRVVDAVHGAGGALARTNLASVNLARVCVDGEQIVVGAAAGAPSAAPSNTSVGTPWPGASSASASAGALVDLNTATADQLDALPGVGPVMAQRILDWRTTHGAFQSVDQLKQVSGIGDAKYADLSPLVTV